MRTIAIIGAGGNAREIAGIIRDLGTFEFMGFLADGKGEYDSPVLGGFDWLESHDVDCLAMGIGNPKAKFSVGEMLGQRHPHIEWPALIHPTAYVGPTCCLEAGAIACVGAIATEHVRVRRFAQLNFGCTVGHEAEIGEASLINPGASISGGVRIGKRVMFGTGARVIQYINVGDDAVVGSGAVVIKDVPAGVKVVGVPAVEIRRRCIAQFSS
jgi:sugar O-acyltransferase (sialic acid O-acetyltransferase NeuD family)